MSQRKRPPSPILPGLSACLVFRATLIVGATLLLAVSAPAQPPKAPGLRGVVLITIDTLRADHLGSHGGPAATPHMDRLAREGADLLHATTPTPSTGPAHASLMTGLHPWRHGVLANAVRLSDEFPTLAALANAEGIATAAVVSSFVLKKKFGLKRGFDFYHFRGSEAYVFGGTVRKRFWSRGETTTKLAIKLLDDFARDDSRRFLLWVHYFDPHSPYAPPSEFAVPKDQEVDLTGKSLTDQVTTHEALEKLNRSYRGEVQYADAQVGQLMAALDRLGLADSTALILTSDHGEGLGDHALIQHGKNLYSELVDVPLIVKAPGITSGQRLEGAAQLEDLFPTILQMLAVPVPGGGDGLDLLPWLKGEVAASPRFSAVGQRRPYADLPNLFYSQRRPLKWIGTIDTPGERFDLERDPHEVFQQKGDGLPASLRTKLDDLSGARAVPVEESTLDPETREALEALGYLPE